MVTDRRLEDGTILQIISDVTYLKLQEKDLVRLREDVIKYLMEFLWDKDEKLIYANKVMWIGKKMWALMWRWEQKTELQKKFS